MTVVRREIKCIETGEVFQSAKQAAEFKKINHGNLSEHLRKGCVGTSGGYHWEVINEICDINQVGVELIENGKDLLIPMQGKDKGRYAIVDNTAENREKMNCYFQIDFRGYPTAVIKQRRIPLHHMVMGVPPKGMVVDHINNDRLDNRKSNLRIIDRGRNNYNKSNIRIDNTSGHTGVYKTKYSWEARIHYNGKIHRLGSFKKYEDAVGARQKAELELYGEHPHYRREYVR